MLPPREATGVPAEKGVIAEFSSISAIIGALTKTAPGLKPITGDNNARRTLASICARLDGSKELVLALAAEDGMPALVVRTLEGRLTPRDLVQLELLRRGLDGIAAPRWWAAEAG